MPASSENKTSSKKKRPSGGGKRGGQDLRAKRGSECVGGLLYLIDRRLDVGVAKRHGTADARKHVVEKF